MWNKREWNNLACSLNFPASSSANHGAERLHRRTQFIDDGRQANFTVSTAWQRKQVWANQSPATQLSGRILKRLGNKSSCHLETSERRLFHFEGRNRHRGRIGNNLGGKACRPFDTRRSPCGSQKDPKTIQASDNVDATMDGFKTSLQKAKKGSLTRDFSFWFLTSIEGWRQKNLCLGKNGHARRKLGQSEDIESAHSKIWGQPV